jgi:hypothetical protein
VIDPNARQLAISCGAALFGARMALAAAQLETVVALLPDRGQPELLATVTITGSTAGPDKDAQRLDAAAESRHSNRRQFATDPVPEDVIDTLRAAGESEGGWLHPVTDLDDRITLARLSQQADAEQNANPAYRAELREWTGVDPQRRDGVPTSAIPHTTGAAQDDIPIRDFDTSGAGELPTETRSRMTQTLLVIGTVGDGQRDWLMAGQALGRVLLELTDAGYVASIYSQPVEVPRTRQALRSELRLSGHPHLLVRAGLAEPTPPTPRRDPEDVITVEQG